MTDKNETTGRWEEIKQIWANWKFLYVAAGFLLGLLAFPATQIIITDIGSFLRDLVPEAVGIVFTVFLVDRIYTVRDERRRTEELKERLVLEAGSSSNETALRAVDELRHRGWLTGKDGLLKGRTFENANLGSANLSSANLEAAYFYRCTLDRANFSGANLNKVGIQETTVRDADFQDADFNNGHARGCNLTGSMFEHTSMTGTDLENAKLFGGYMSWVRLHGSNLKNMRMVDVDFSGDLKQLMDSRTVLPDGTTWDEATDMRRFGCILR